MSTNTVAGVIDRVQKLIALTTSPFDGEARTAALRAAELIRQHGLRLVAPGQVAEPGPRHRTEEPGEWRWIRSKFPGSCVTCGSRYFEGDNVSWLKGKGCRCETCYYNAHRRGAA